MSLINNQLMSDADVIMYDLFSHSILPNGTSLDGNQPGWEIVSLNCKDVLLNISLQNPDFVEVRGFNYSESVKELYNQFDKYLSNNGMVRSVSDLIPPGCFSIFFSEPFQSYYCSVGMQIVYWPCTVLFWIVLPLAIVLAVAYLGKCIQESSCVQDKKIYKRELSNRQLEMQRDVQSATAQLESELQGLSKYKKRKLLTDIFS